MKSSKQYLLLSEETEMMKVRWKSAKKLFFGFLAIVVGLQLILSILRSQEFSSSPLLRRFHHTIHELPNFSTDLSEYFLGAVIEGSLTPRQQQQQQQHRQSSSIAIFLWGHQNSDNYDLSSHENQSSVDKLKWKTFLEAARKTRYTSSGLRKPNFAKFSCRIKDSRFSMQYESGGTFVPNKIASKSSQRIDILTCPLKDYDEAATDYHFDGGTITIDIIKDSQPIMHFTMPPTTPRRIGFLMSTPPSSPPPPPPPPAFPHSNTSHLPSVFICIPGIERLDTNRFAIQVLEFVSHHFNLGIDHIIISTSLSIGSMLAQDISRRLKSYNNDRHNKKLTLLFHSDDETPLTLHGMIPTFASIVAYQANICLYLCRGFADYLILLDLDEFIIPRSSQISLKAQIQTFDPKTPPCFIALHEQVHISRHSCRNRFNGDCYFLEPELETALPFAFREKFTRAIISTSMAQFVSKDAAVTCQMESKMHSLPTRDIDRQEIVVFHFLSTNIKVPSNRLGSINYMTEYQQYWFPSVISDLRARNLIESSSSGSPNASLLSVQTLNFNDIPPPLIDSVKDRHPSSQSPSARLELNEASLPLVCATLNTQLTTLYLFICTSSNCPQYSLQGMSFDLSISKGTVAVKSKRIISAKSGYSIIVLDLVMSIRRYQHPDTELLVRIAYTTASVFSFKISTRPRQRYFGLLPEAMQFYTDVNRATQADRNQQRLVLVSYDSNPKINIRLVARYLEFVQHHILLHFQLIILVVPLHSTSAQFLALREIFEDFISERSLLLVAKDHIGSVGSVELQADLISLVTFTLQRETLIASWPIDEFFIPSLGVDFEGSRSLMNRFKSTCQVNIGIVDFLGGSLSHGKHNDHNGRNDDHDQNNLWLSNFMVYPLKQTSSSSVVFRRILFSHDYCEGWILFGKNSRPSDSTIDIQIGKLTKFIEQLVPNAANMTFQGASEYSTTFSPAVRAELRDRRNLEILISLPESLRKPNPTLDHDWTPYEIVFDRAQSTASITSTAPSTAEPFLREDFGLPSWAVDQSELFLSAIIERQQNSRQLYLTIFLLSHTVLTAEKLATNMNRINDKDISKWEFAFRRGGFANASYKISGERQSNESAFFCRISPNDQNTAQSYDVPGMFVPNALSFDTNVNQCLDILRCPLQDSQRLYQSLANRSVSLYAEIFHDQRFLIRFKIPWVNRHVGDMLQTTPQSSRFDFWQGGWHFPPSSPSSPSTPPLGIVLCAPGWDSPPSRKNLPQYLEFIQHHLLIGVDHIFISVTFHWQSPHMQRILQCLKSFIDEGKVTVMSHSIDGVDYLYTLLGSSWKRDLIKVQQVNMCTYLAKGLSQYVAIWDFDEFFIPRGNYTSILQVVEAAENRRNSRADLDHHDYCFFILNSKVIANKEFSSRIDAAHPWIGERFDHGEEFADSRVANQFSFEKSIIPTDRIFQVGLHLSGACRLDPVWNGCSETNTELCFGKIGPEAKQLLPDDTPFRKWHYFNEFVTRNDTIAISTNDEAAIFHFMSFRFYHTIQHAESLVIQNDYSSNFFNETLTALGRRKLRLLVLLPYYLSRPQP